MYYRNGDQYFVEGSWANNLKGVVRIVQTGLTPDTVGEVAMPIQELEAFDPIGLEDIPPLWIVAFGLSEPEQPVQPSSEPLPEQSVRGDLARAVLMLLIPFLIAVLIYRGM